MMCVHQNHAKMALNAKELDLNLNVYVFQALKDLYVKMTLMNV